MTTYAKVRKALVQQAKYYRTKRELEQLPVELAIEDLGIYPGDAAKVAHQAVYG